jgi:hypothetical protein
MPDEIPGRDFTEISCWSTRVVVQRPDKFERRRDLPFFPHL